MPSKPRRTALLCRVSLGLLVLLAAGPAQTHPLGNNTVSRAAQIELGLEGVRLTYRLDLAEIPTLIAAAQADVAGDGETDTADWDALARRRAAEVHAGLELRADGAPLGLAQERVEWRLVPGAAGLATLRLDLVLTAPWPGSVPAAIAYRDARRVDEPGWKEVTARAGPGVRLTGSDVPQVSPSQGLTAYPAPEAATSAVLAAHLEVEVLAPATPAAASPVPSVADLPAAQAPQARAQPWAFFRLGLHHIANGLDHLVFLLGLLAGQRSLRCLAWVITAFTIAHGVALGLAASGWVVPPTAWVEPAIGLTILYVGIASLAGGLRHGARVAFGFGLVHGFGFAGALAQHLTAAGSAWLLDLAAFNLGVEAGQLAWVLLALLLVRGLRQLEVAWPVWAAWLPGGIVGSLGAFWTIQRTSILLGVSK